MATVTVTTRVTSENANASMLVFTPASGTVPAVALVSSTGSDLSAAPVNNGFGLNVVVLNEVPVKGMAAVGDLATGLLPIVGGGFVGAGIAQRTLQADSRVVQQSYTGDGRLLTLNIGPPEDQCLTTPVLAAAGTGTQTLIAAQAAGIKTALWGLEVANTSAINTVALIQDGSHQTIGRVGIAGNSARFAGPWPGPMKTTAATALTFNFTTDPGANTVSLTPFAYITKE